MQRAVASPRLGVSLPGGGGDSPSKNSGFFNGKKHQDATSQRTQLLVILSVALNVAVIGLLLFKSCSAPSTHEGGIQATNFATTGSDASSEALVAAHARELSTLQSTLTSLKIDLKTAQASEKLANSELKDLQVEHASLQKKYEKLQESGAGAGSATDNSAELKDLQREHSALQKKYEKLQEEVKSGATAPAVTLRETGDCACRQQTRLSSDDLALQGSRFDLASHEFEWKCDEELLKPKGNMTFCPETATSEQYFQLTFFDRPGAGSKVAVRKGRPVSPTCVQLPPRDYVWPTKHAQIPVTKGTDGVNWPNLRVATLKDLLVFNRGTPKNLYHFNASFYDYEQEAIVSHAAKYIPFDQKVRIMMDIGSGGGSLGLLLKRRYDVQVVSTVFADWPYCEYITERGNLCMYLDAMEAMPFAKFSYDILHSSWVFHALLNHQLVHTFLEQNRILRPGGCQSTQHNRQQSASGSSRMY
jgi:hypothetical protein